MQESKSKEIDLDDTICIDTTESSSSSNNQTKKDQRPVIPPSSQPTIIPLYPEPNPIVGGEIKRLACQLCSGRQSFKSDYDFDMHLTKIHYEEHLMKRIRYPYKCEKCFYSPADCLTKEEKEEDLLIHYGCNEKLSIQYYKDECTKIQQPTPSSTPSQEATEISCEMCNSSHENERLFVRHITVRHFTKQVILNLCIYFRGMGFSVCCLVLELVLLLLFLQLSDELPKKAPFICPFVNCKQEKSNEHLLMMHYGVEHNRSMELYRKKKAEMYGHQDHGVSEKDSRKGTYSRSLL